MVSRIRVAVATHARKESFFCRLWSRHYGELFGYENLILFKDGDDWDLPPDARFGTVVPVRFSPKREECDLQFAEMYGRECSRLLEHYDVVLRTDVDEFLVVDPQKGTWDDVLSEVRANGYIFATGLDVIQHETEEAAYDPSRPVLEQRRHALVRGEYFKPCAVARPVRWTVACHALEGEPVILSKALVLVHLAMMDRELLDSRGIERGDQSNPSYRAHAKWRLKLFDAIQNDKAWDLDEAWPNIRERLSKPTSGQSAPSPFFKTIRAPDGSVSRRWLNVIIPERFSDLISALTAQTTAQDEPSIQAQSADVQRLEYLLDLLKPNRLTTVVDIGASGIEPAPYAFLAAHQACEVWGFEPQPDEFRKLVEGARRNEHYLPHAVGDGSTKRLRITRNPGFTSTLNPNPKTSSALKRWKNDIKIVAEQDVATVRLDDIKDLPPFDLLKIDIQGGEIDVFENGRDRLSNVIAVITEAAAIPIYENQPLLGEQLLCLSSLGFQLHKFAFFRSVPIRSSLSSAIPRRRIADQLTDGDIICIRHLLDIESHDTESLKHLAIIADFVFNSASLALKAVEVLVRRGEILETRARRYSDLISEKVSQR